MNLSNIKINKLEKELKETQAQVASLKQIVNNIQLTTNHLLDTIAKQPTFDTEATPECFSQTWLDKVVENLKATMENETNNH